MLPTESKGAILYLFIFFIVTCQVLSTHIVNASTFSKKQKNIKDDQYNEQQHFKQIVQKNTKKSQSQSQIIQQYLDPNNNVQKYEHFPSRDLLNQNKVQLNKRILMQNEFSIHPNYKQSHIDSFYEGKKSIVSRQFDNIGLYHGIPQNYISGEVYRFHGVVLNTQLLKSEGPLKYDFVSIIFSEIKDQYEFRCVDKVTKNYQFQISCRMQRPGAYLVSIFPGKNGRSSRKLKTITAYQSIILENPSNYFKPSDPFNLRIDIINNNLYIIWDSYACLTNLTIYQHIEQGIIKLQYLLSNNHRRFKIPFLDFQSFRQTTTYVQISHAESLDGSLSLKSTNFGQNKAYLNFQASHHLFDQTTTESIKSITSIPWMIQKQDIIHFSAIFKQDIKNQVYIIQPDLKIRVLHFTQNNHSPIKAGSPVSLSLKFYKQGNHILQINAVSGLAIVNRPIYIGNRYPLTPDYQDLEVLSYNAKKKINLSIVYQRYYQRTTGQIEKSQPSKYSSIQQKRQYLLNLLNGLRRKHSLDTVQIDDKLNEIAQYHVNDMIKNKYFSHRNLYGEGPRERATKMNFYNSIGQNIAQASLLIQAHLALERSAAHLQNSVNQMWTRVGIGVNISQSDQYVVAFQFSTRDFNRLPLSEYEQRQLEEDLIDLIMQKNKNIKKQNKRISQDLRLWLRSDRTVKFFQYVLDQGDYKEPTMASYFTVNYSKDWIEKLRKSNKLLGFNQFEQVGVAVGALKDKNGMIQSYIIFN